MCVEDLYNYFLEKNILSDDNIEAFRIAFAELGEIMPGDKISASRKDTRLINVSEDVSWNRLAISNYYNKLRTNYNKTRDNMYTMLVRQNRPSNEAICCEIRSKNNLIGDMEEEMRKLDDALIWVDHIEKSIDRYIYAMKDKFKKDTVE